MRHVADLAKVSQTTQRSELTVLADVTNTVSRHSSASRKW